MSEKTIAFAVATAEAFQFLKRCNSILYDVFQKLQYNLLQGVEDPQDALSFQVISLKRALYLVALLRKETCD